MSADEARVAVVLPTLRADRLLDLAIESVLQQTHAAFRLVVAFDGAPSLPDRAWMRDGRIEIRRSAERQGLAMTLRSTIETIDTEYIARLDADDVSHPHRLERQISYLDAHPETVVVGTGAQRIDLAGNELGPFPTVPGDDVRESLLERNVVVHSSVMMRRDAYETAGGFDSEMRQMEDYDLWLRMARLGPVAVLPTRMIDYRLHGDQVSRKAQPFADYTWKVRRSRQRLRRAIGLGLGKYVSSELRWTGAQVLRATGLRKPGYDQGLDPSREVAR